MFLPLRLPPGKLRGDSRDLHGNSPGILRGFLVSSQGLPRAFPGIYLKTAVVLHDICLGDFERGRFTKGKKESGETTSTQGGSGRGEGGDEGMEREIVKGRI